MKILITFAIAVMLVSQSCNNQSAKENESTSETENPFHENLKSGTELLDGLRNYVNDIETNFSQIPVDRKKQLEKISFHVESQSSAGAPSNLIFICTHNSRRSHMSQFWAQTAAHYYGIGNVHCYSGGTEATAFNHRTVRALRNAGFNIEQTDSTSNPVYLVYYAEGVEPVKGFSKKYDDPFNPQSNFAAIMTCSEADESCPQVHGASIRVAIPFDDPKIADNSPQEESKYDERCRQIANEMFYVFSKITLD